ncbi:hypothetical protein I3843_07G079000 [Carya illinoinensis]|uniref:Uncharacterized protein n=1 Tax=Carya illinoinensis TaxID=32201 RepID=A0A922EI57_CARIL|nr:hypothetical protein I3842_07G082200 [Carya illinoinensis]KAG7970340.1 hypothetical protein I3843_07G079000 [Carya illinoinensis]
MGENRRRWEKIGRFWLESSLGLPKTHFSFLCFQFLQFLALCLIQAFVSIALAFELFSLSLFSVSAEYFQQLLCLGSFSVVCNFSSNDFQLPSSIFLFDLR